MTWDEVIFKVRDKLIAGVDYVKKITIVPSNTEYIEGNLGNVQIDDYAILLSVPDGGAYSAEPLLAGLKRKRFDIVITIIPKSDPATLNRMWGVGVKKGTFKIQDDVVIILEHNTLDGTVDSKAGTNFEVPWIQLETNNKAVTAYTTIYSAIKTEK